MVDTRLDFASLDRRRIATILSSMPDLNVLAGLLAEKFANFLPLEVVDQPTKVTLGRAGLLITHGFPNVHQARVPGFFEPRTRLKHIVRCATVMADFLLVIIVHPFFFVFVMSISSTLARTTYIYFSYINARFTRNATSSGCFFIVSRLRSSFLSNI